MIKRTNNPLKQLECVKWNYDATNNVFSLLANSVTLQNGIINHFHILGIGLELDYQKKERRVILVRQLHVKEFPHHPLLQF